MRILFVLPELPHPPFTGAHARPLTLMRAAARSHEVAVVGAAASDADLGLLEEIVRGGRSGAGGRSQTGAAAHPGRRQAAGHAGPARERRPVASRSPSSSTSWSPPGSRTRWSVETLYAAHYRVAGHAAHRRPSGRPQRALRVGGRGAPGPLPRRQPAGGDEPAVRAPPARRHRPREHQRRRPRAPGHARHGVLHDPAGHRPAAGGPHLRARLHRAARRGRAAAVHRLVRPPAEPRRGQVAGALARARAAHRARAVRHGHRRPAGAAVAAARPAAPASP